MNDLVGNSIDDYRLPRLWMYIPYGSIAGGLVDSLDLLSRFHGFRDLLFSPTTRPHLFRDLISYSYTATKLQSL